ncbi:hypothetical protein ETD83_38025 [Actinomadura soli]|uniref:Integral membrane protein n=2 Tax=Actinomadura soli TaxID=2508997 RepID=A0A5C4J099_9ACTN|nr:hypothetical protein ETD83_38025 [Actinomadura soli]
MAGRRRAAAGPDDRERADYSGAVYGSLLAASVIVGASPRHDPAPAATVVALLFATGLVFWLAHVYASLVGDRQHGRRLDWPEIRSVGRREWPLAQAAVPPAAAAACCGLIGLSDATASWAALFVALGGQVGWTVAAGARAHAGGRLIVMSAVVSLLLGMIIVALKVILTH